MRLCEYVKVPQQEKQCTEILRLRNLRFFNNGRLVPHNNPGLEYSNCLNITFKMQKKDKKNNTTTQMASGNITHNLRDLMVVRMQGGATPAYVQTFAD